MAKKSKPKPKKAPSKKTSGKWRIFKKILKWTSIVVLGLMVFSVLMVIAYRLLNPPVTPLMISRSMNGVKTQAKGPWIPYEQIPQKMVDAVVASEDNKFADHHGFDFGEMREAYQQNKKGKRLRGASTITQQMCKNVFLWNGRSYIRKGLEAWFTLWVELLWSKQRIMEVYLNVIEMGNGIYGIGAAAQSYYHKPVAKLSREEAAMIAAILPSPRKRNPAKPTAYMWKRQRQILDLMDKIGTVKL
jgi:monofunctional biosynthetic peptidoglycan transglycosylase